MASSAAAPAGKRPRGRAKFLVSLGSQVVRPSRFQEWPTMFLLIIFWQVLARGWGRLGTCGAAGRRRRAPPPAHPPAPSDREAPARGNRRSPETARPV